MNTGISRIRALLSHGGQVTTEYVLATGMFLVIFVWFHTIVQTALKKLFAGAAFIILTSWR